MPDDHKPPLPPDALEAGVYERLRDVAAARFRQSPGALTIQPTELVHEAYLKIAQSESGFEGSRTHFYAVAATTIKQVLIDHLRKRGRVKHGGQHERVTLEGIVSDVTQREMDLLAFMDLLDQFSKIDPRAARVFELRYFGGMKEKEVASILEVSDRTVRSEWAMARAWLQRRLTEDEAP